MPRARRIDVFCRVVDNFGDAGVAWRLARQLAAEHGVEVTLFIDDIAPLARIVPGVAAVRDDQLAEGVCIRHRDAHGTGDVPDAIVDAFGDAVPDAYLDRVEHVPRPPLWIVLEYLSAEAWVDDRHGLPSPPARRALQRWYFFPGFTPATGGLLRERDVGVSRAPLARRDDARSEAWRDAGLPAPEPSALAVSLFCYPNRALAPLLRAWAHEAEPVACIVPEGVATDALGIAFDGWRPAAAEARRDGRLTVGIARFVDQPAFDRRLRASDIAFVRGEDSFVRAQWAAVPFVWHAYPQADRAHAVKVDAFLSRYLAHADAADAEAVRTLWRAFDDEDADAIVPAWHRYRARLPALRRHASQWAAALAAQDDLATRLVRFIADRL